MNKKGNSNQPKNNKMNMELYDILMENLKKYPAYISFLYIIIIIFFVINIVAIKLIIH